MPYSSPPVHMAVDACRGEEATSGGKKSLLISKWGCIWQQGQPVWGKESLLSLSHWNWVCLSLHPSLLFTQMQLKLPCLQACTEPKDLGFDEVTAWLIQLHIFRASKRQMFGLIKNWGGSLQLHQGIMYWTNILIKKYEEISPTFQGLLL